MPCKKSRLCARPVAALAQRHLGGNRGNDADARQSWSRADVPAGGSKPGRVLSLSSATAAERRRHGGARRHPADGAGAPAPLRLPARNGRAAPPWSGGEPQEGGAADAHRQPARGPAQSLRGHHPVRPCVGDLSEPGAAHEADRDHQIWVADITYIRLRGEFVYLAMVLDVFSRKVVGWELGRTLIARLALMALERAVGERKPPPGLVHYSDRGVQYACDHYVTLLGRHQMLPCMSQPGNPYDNAFCESFIKTLKREEIYAHPYHDMAELRTHIEQFIEQYYNRQRLHSALGYQSPDEFEAAAQPASSARASVSFPRHGEIYRSPKPGGRPRNAVCGEPVKPNSPPHRIDESPVGYSLAGWSPPEPTSASPTTAESEFAQPK